MTWSRAELALMVAVGCIVAVLAVMTAILIVVPTPGDCPEGWSLVGLTETVDRLAIVCQPAGR